MTKPCEPNNLVNQRVELLLQPYAMLVPLSLQNEVCHGDSLHTNDLVARNERLA